MTFLTRTFFLFFLAFACDASEEPTDEEIGPLRKQAAIQIQKEEIETDLSYIKYLEWSQGWWQRLETPLETIGIVLAGASSSTSAFSNGGEHTSYVTASYWLAAGSTLCGSIAMYAKSAVKQKEEQLKALRKKYQDYLSEDPEAG